MINRDDIEAGDKVYTRDGGCLVAREVGGVIWIGGLGAHHWHSKGGYLMYETHPLDLIRIEKAPKPVVEEFITYFKLASGENTKLKLVFVNNVWDKEKSEQVK